MLDPKIKLSQRTSPGRWAAWALLLTATLAPSLAGDEPGAKAPTAIDALPCRIQRPGAYRLSGDLLYSELRGAAITVEADDVQIDLNHQALRGDGGPDSLAIGILAVGRRRLAISRGAIEGFYFGIDLRAASSPEADSPPERHVVSHVALRRNWYFGMRVAGAQCEVRACQILDTGGSARDRHTIPHGVRLVGPGNAMRDCLVQDLRLKRFPAGQGEIVGVHFDAAPGGVFERNRLIELHNSGDDAFPGDDRRERRFGVWVNGGPGKDTFLLVRENHFEGFTVPLAFAPGSKGVVSKNAYRGAAPRPVRGDVEIRGE